MSILGIVKLMSVIDLLCSMDKLHFSF